MITIGVDEAGRGALAGDVVAAAVIFPRGFSATGVADSKILSAERRAQLFDFLSKKCRFAIGRASVAEIDRLNILEATMLAMRRAIFALDGNYDQVIVDGNRCPNVENCRAIIRGDAGVPLISAASIIAKTTRDLQMRILNEHYPEYGFARHKGYGTKMHLAALSRFGAITGCHRQSFAPVKNLSQKPLINNN